MGQVDNRLELDEKGNSGTENRTQEFSGRLD